MVVILLKDQYESQRIDGYSAFRKEAMTGISGRIKAEEVANALLKDLRDDDCLDVRLSHALVLLRVYTTPGHHTIVKDERYVMQRGKRGRLYAAAWALLPSPCCKFAVLRYNDFAGQCSLIP